QRTKAVAKCWQFAVQLLASGIEIRHRVFAIGVGEFSHEAPRIPVVVEAKRDELVAPGLAAISKRNAFMCVGLSRQNDLLNGCNLSVAVSNCADLLHAVQVRSVAELRHERPERRWKRTTDSLFGMPHFGICRSRV